MKKVYLLLFVLFAAVMGWSQTNPTPQTLPYTQNFSVFDGSQTAYPAGWQGGTITGSTSASYPTAAAASDQALASGTAASNSATSAFVGDAVGKIAFLSTSANMKSILFAVNTTGASNVNVTFTAATQRQQVGNRIGAIGLQYRVGTTGTFTDVAGSEYQNNVAADNTTGTTAVDAQTKTVVLPAACNNAPVVQLRWVYRDVSGANNRPGFSITNVSVASGTTAAPSLTAGTLADFGNITVGANSTSQSFSLSGTDLTGAPGTITVTAPSTDFQVSNDNSTWGASTTIAYTTATLASTPVYVRFTPQSAGAKSGNITISGGGAATTVAVSGTGVAGTPPAAPVATAATAVGSTGFTANWNAVSGATGYFLDVYTLTGGATATIAGWTFPTSTSASQTANQGNANNNGIQTVTATNIGTLTYPGGPASGVNSVSAPGWNASGDRYWQINVNTTGVTGLTLSSLQGSSATGPKEFKIQYRIGATGAWTDLTGGTITITTAVAAGSATTWFGVTDLALPAACDNQALVSIRWINTSSVSVNDATVAAGGTSRISQIFVKGTDAGGAPAYVTGYENLSVGNVTSYAVTGLAASTTYYYVVRAANANGTSANSNVISVATTAGATPSLTAGTLSDFGSVNVGTNSTSQSFNLSGADLTGAPGTITVTSPSADFQVSNDNSTWGASTNIAYTTATLTATPVYVRFTPQSAGAKSGNITISGGGATATVAVSGTGVAGTPPTAPVATAATIIGSTSFTANWNAVSGATGYFLDVYTLGSTSGATIAGWTFPTSTSASQTANQGNANNNGIQTVTATNIGTLTYPGGPASGVNSVSAPGWNASGDRYWQIDVNTTGVTGLTLSSLQGSSATGPKEFKIQYRIGATGTWTDVSGGAITITTAVAAGNAATWFGVTDLALPAACDNQPLVSIRWINTSSVSVNDATVAAGGTSRISQIFVKGAGGSGGTPVYVTGYENLSVANVTSYAVTGLAASTTYYYVVRATNASGTSANSNEITVTTTAGATPSLTAGTLADFGNITVGTNSTSQSFNLSGANLTGAPGTITVTAPSTDFQVSNDNSTWGASTTIAYTTATLTATPVYVRFTPQSAGAKSGNVTISGGGATATVAVSGTGVTGGTPPAAPVATAATAVGSTGFTANWNAVTGATGYFLDVYTLTGGAGVTIAGWTFPTSTSASQTANQGNANNSGVQTVTGNNVGTISYPGGPASGVFSVGAADWTAAGDKYWLINVNTTGVTGLTLSSLQGSSGTGPKDFKIQYRVGATGAWTDLAGGVVTMTAAVTAGSAANWAGVTDLALPSECNNQPLVSIRWINTSSVSVNNAAVAAGGTSRISQIFVKGAGGSGGTPVYVTGYQNLSVGNVTSYAVTGLAASTTYYYVVRAANASGTSANSNEITVTTLAPVCDPPVTQASAITFTNVAATSMTVSWVNGSGSGRVVKINTTNSFTAPVDGNTPAANAVYAGTGEQVVYNGTASTVNVSGLTTGVTYYFRVYEYNCTPPKYNASTATGNPASQATPVVPVLTATSLTAFGSTCINTTAGPNSFTLTGVNLTAAAITVGPLSGYTFSTTSGGTYTTTLTITQPGGTFSQQIFVRFTPTAAQSYNGNIPVTGGGVSITVNVAASGLGVNTPPSAVTGDATAITTTGATISGSLGTSGCSSATTYGIEYSGISGFASGTGIRVAGTNLSGSNFSVNLTGLIQGATYYYKAYASTGSSISYGIERSFTVAAVSPAFTIYPVPVVRGTELRFSKANITPGYYAVVISNSAGQQVYRKDINIQATFINQTLVVPATLPPGVYRLQLVSNTKIVAIKSLIIQ